MSENLGSVVEHKLVMESFIKVERIVNRLGSLYPEDPFSWVGTVDDRLEYLIGKMIKDPNKVEIPDEETAGKLLKHYMYVRDYNSEHLRGQTKEAVMLDDHAFTNQGVPLDLSWAFTKAPKDENGVKVSAGVIFDDHNWTAPLGSDHPQF